MSYLLSALTKNSKIDTLLCNMQSHKSTVRDTRILKQKLKRLGMQPNSQSKKAERDYSKGIKLLEDYLQTHEATSDILREHAFFLYHLGIAKEAHEGKSIATKYYKQAHSVCKKAVESDSSVNKNTLVNILMTKAQIEGLLGKKDMALATAKKGRSLLSNFVTTQRIASLYSMFNDHNRQLYWLRKAYKDAPSEFQPFGYGEIGMALYKLGRLTLAKKYIDSSLKTLPRNIEGNTMRTMLRKMQ